LEKEKWTSKDWKWTIGILIGIIILIISLWIGDNKVSVNVSIASSGFSIALALVAIFISLKQDSDTGRLNNQMNSTLSRMDGKLDTVEQKVNQIDLGLIKEVLQQKLDENFTLVKNEVDSEKFTTEEINDLLDKQKEEMNKDINNFLRDINENLANKTKKNVNEEKMEIESWRLRTPRTKTQYYIGDRIFHEKWGEGSVLWVEAVPNSDYLQETLIKFDTNVIGNKKLLAQFAPMKKIKEESKNKRRSSN
jgi:hypothetical protein